MRNGNFIPSYLKAFYATIGKVSNTVYSVIIVYVRVFSQSTDRQKNPNMQHQNFGLSIVEMLRIGKYNMENAWNGIVFCGFWLEGLVGRRLFIIFAEQTKNNTVIYPPLGWRT